MISCLLPSINWFQISKCPGKKQTSQAMPKEPRAHRGTAWRGSWIHALSELKSGRKLGTLQYTHQPSFVIVQHSSLRGPSNGKIPRPYSVRPIGVIYLSIYIPVYRLSTYLYIHMLKVLPAWIFCKTIPESKLSLAFSYYDKYYSYLLLPFHRLCRSLPL